MSKYVIEVDDTPMEDLPFADSIEYFCQAIGTTFTAEELGKLKKLENGKAQDAKPELKTRQDILDAAMEIVAGKREEYGDPEDSFETIAELWSAYLRAASHRSDLEIASTDVAVMMVLLKVARCVGSQKIDNYIDMAGYAACAGELDGRY